MVMILLFAVISFFSINQVCATDQVALAAVHSVGDRGVIYMAPRVARSYINVGGSISSQKSRRDTMLYATGFNARDFIAAFKDQLLRGTDDIVVITLRDGSYFLFSRHLLCSLGAAVSEHQVVQSDARSLRSYARMLYELHDDLAGTVCSKKIAQYIREYIERKGENQVHIRQLRRAGWALGVAEWVDEVFAEYEASPGNQDDSDTSSVSSEESCASTESGISFASEYDRYGQRRKRHDIARLMFTEGQAAVKERFNNEGIFNLQGCGLTSIHDLSLLHAVLSYTDRSQVNTIDLSDNLLTEIPHDAFIHFPSLRTIVLKNNTTLTEVSPEAFSGLHSLRLLDMSGCALESLPDQLFMNNKKIEVLLCDHNKLKRLPSLSGLEKLSMLSAHHNQLTMAPDVTQFVDLEIINLSYNNLTRAVATLLPGRPKSSLKCAFFSHNKITSIDSGFLDRLAEGEVINMSNNPLWKEEYTDKTEDLLAKVGYEQIDDKAKEQGVAIAAQVRKALLDDMTEKLFEYMLSHGLIKAKVLKDEVVRKRAFGKINTKAADVGMWVYRYGGWLVFGATLLFGGIGSVVGYVLKKAAMKRAKRVAIGAGVGAAVGAVAGFIGYQIWNDSRDFYLSSGGDEVYMTSDLRSQYVGTSRLLVLLVVLKQYLIACNICLYWVLKYDEFLGDNDHLDEIMDHFEEQLHVTAKQVLARTSDAACITMIMELLEENPLKAVNSYAADGMFSASSLENQSISDGAIYGFLGSDKLVVVRNAICRFGKVAKTLKAMLFNRYIGAADQSKILHLASKTDDLKDGLNLVITDVLTPTLNSMVSAGHSDEVWYKELFHLKTVSNETQDLLKELVAQAESMATLYKFGGVVQS